MLHFTPITAALLAAALQTSAVAQGSGTSNAGAPNPGARGIGTVGAGAPTAIVASGAERLARALAEWELYAATSGEDTEVATRLEALTTEAREAVAAAPTDAGVARSAEAIEAARTRFRTERGLERAPGQEKGRQPGQEPRDPRASDEEVIATAILNHLHAEQSEGRQEAILRFGPRAVPALVDSARSMSAANALGAPAIALDTLAIIDPLKALEVSWDLSEQPSFLVRQAIARVLSRRMVYSEDAVWVAREGGDHVPAAPEWGQLVERLLSEPAVAPKDMRNVLAACVSRGYAPQVVIDAIYSFDEIEEWPQLGAVPPGARPLYLSGLQHPRAIVRRHCASHVSRFPDATPIFALHSDEDVEVRKIVATALGERTVAQPGPTIGSVERTHRVPPVPGPEHQAALEHCLSDDDFSISRTAGSIVERAYHTLKLPLLPAADLARLAVSVPHLEIRVSLLSILATFAPELVAGAVERTLSDPALRAQEKHYSQAFYALVSGTRSAEHASAIASAVLTALETHATPEEWSTLSLGSNNSQPNVLLVHLTDAQRVQLVRTLARHRPDAAWTHRNAWSGVAHDSAPWRALVLDASASGVARAVAVGWSLGDEETSPEHITAIIDAVLAVAQERTSPVLEWRELAQWLGGISYALNPFGEQAQRFLTALFADRRVPDELLLELRLNQNFGIEEDRAELARAIVARFPVDSWASNRTPNLFVDVLLLAHTLDPEQRIELIEGALLARKLVEHALNAASRSRDPELLDSLRRYTQRFEDAHLVRVATAAASFLSDDAAKLILELAARTSNSETRAQILASLQQVIDYQTALAKWQQRNDATAVRVRAIGELVAVIDDPSLPEAQRAEAVRGLGLLGAVEELPRLVRTLTAPSEALRTAAREALDRLNAAPVK